MSLCEGKDILFIFDQIIYKATHTHAHDLIIIKVAL